MDWQVGDRFRDPEWKGFGDACGVVMDVDPYAIYVRYDGVEHDIKCPRGTDMFYRLEKVEPEEPELVNADDLPSMTLEDLRAIADKLNPPVTQPDPLRDLIEEAYSIVNGSRQADYGPPEDNFARIAKRWSTHAGVTVCAEDAALMMIDLKLARLKATPDHRDSVVDLIGYALCYWRIVSKS